VDWMHLAQDRDQWWIVLNTVFYKRYGISWPTKLLSTSQVGLCFMKLVSELRTFFNDAWVATGFFLLPLLPDHPWDSPSLLSNLFRGGIHFLGRETAAV
jgi:hypothetical protein